jgi:hypothetical protein
MRAAIILAVCFGLTAFAGGPRSGNGRGFTNPYGGSINPGPTPRPAPVTHASPRWTGPKLHSAFGGPAAPVAPPAPSAQHNHHGHGHAGYGAYGFGVGPYGYGGFYGYGYGYPMAYTYYPGATYPDYPPEFGYRSDYEERPDGYQGQGGTYVDPNNPDDGDLVGEEEPPLADENAGPGQLFEVAPNANAQAEEPAPAPAPAAKKGAKQAAAAKPEQEPAIFHWVDADGTDHYSTDLPADQRGKATKMAYDGSLLSWTPVTSAEADAAQGKTPQK